MRPIRHKGYYIKNNFKITFFKIIIPIIIILILSTFLFNMLYPPKKIMHTKYLPLNKDRNLIEASRGTDIIYEKAFYEYQLKIAIPETPIISDSKTHPAELSQVYQKDDVKTAYLTFDDGPNPSVTPKILDVLKEYNVQATFFVIGELASKYPEIIKRASDEGHLIANHSNSHNYNKVYESKDSFSEEIAKCEETLKSIIGDKYKKLFRFPGGSFETSKKPYKDILRSKGYKYADWNALSGDAETKTPTAIYIINNISKSTYGRSKVVILMHDAGAKKITADTLPKVIELLKSRGFTFKPLM